MYCCWRYIVTTVARRHSWHLFPSPVTGWQVVISGPVSLYLVYCPFSNFFATATLSEAKQCWSHGDQFNWAYLQSSAILFADFYMYIVWLSIMCYMNCVSSCLVPCLLAATMFLILLAKPADVHTYKYICTLTYYFALACKLSINLLSS